jgi:hypothetical protein
MSCSVILKIVICCLDQSLAKESRGGSETTVVVWTQMLDERRGGRRNGKRKRGKKLGHNYVRSYSLFALTFVGESFSARIEHVAVCLPLLCR